MKIKSRFEWEKKYGAKAVQKAKSWHDGMKSKNFLNLHRWQLISQEIYQG